MCLNTKCKGTFSEDDFQIASKLKVSGDNSAHSMDPALSPEVGTNTTDQEGAGQDEEPCGSLGLYTKGKAAFS